MDGLVDGFFGPAPAVGVDDLVVRVPKSTAGLVPHGGECENWKREEGVQRAGWGRCAGSALGRDVFGVIVQRAQNVLRALVVSGFRDLVDLRKQLLHRARPALPVKQAGSAVGFPAFLLFGREGFGKLRAR